MPAGYSTTPLARKIGIHSGDRITYLDPPPDWCIPDLPEGLVSGTLVPGETGVDVLIAFCRSLAALRDAVPIAEAAIAADGMVWFAWPRRAGGYMSDVTDNAIRDEILPRGLVDVKVAALDEAWSGLKIVWRKERRGRR